MIRWACAVGLLTVLAIVVAGPRADAHALVRSSTPANGAVLDQAPSEVEITFTETPDPKLTFLEVLDAQGTDHAKGDVSSVSGDAHAVRVTVGDMPDGVYTVTWRTTSKADGHTTSGSFSFGVGVSQEEIAAAPKQNTGNTTFPGPLAVAGRWTLYWGLALLFAAAVTAFVVFGGGLRFRSPILWGAGALAVIGFALMVVAEKSNAGVPYGTLFSSTSGRHLIREGVGVVAAAIAVPFAARGRGRPTLLVVCVAAAATMLLHAMNSHAAASSPAWFNVGVQWVHLLAVGAWIGGLVWLLASTIRRAETDPEPGPPVARFSWLAGILLLVVAATGITRAIDEVGGPPDWGRLIDTSFGVTLLVKVGLFLVLVAFAARNRYVNVPRVQRDTHRVGILRRAVGAEVLLAVGIFGATGVLSELPPAATVAASRQPQPPQAVVITGHDFATSRRVTLTVTPGTVGPNTFKAVVVDYDTEEPVPARGVVLTFRLPGHPELGAPTLELDPGGPGIWTGEGTVLSIQGRWDVTVTVQEQTTGVEVPLQVQTRLPPQRVTVSRQEGQPTLYTIELSQGRTLQAYVDPGSVGRNTVHFTFFDASGKEFRIKSATATETPPSGSSNPLKLIRFSKGHFVANVTLDEGTWLFQIQATTDTGETLSAYFQPKIGG